MVRVMVRVRVRARVRVYSNILLHYKLSTDSNSAHQMESEYILFRNTSQKKSLYAVAYCKQNGKSSA